MTNKDRKKKVIKWLLVGLGCVVLFGVLYGIDSIIVGYNRSQIMEYRLSGGISGGLKNTIDRSTSYYIIFWSGFIISILGLIISVIMFIVNLVNCWLNNTTEEVQQQVVKNDSDTLVQLSRMYHDGLLTKQEFEKQKKQLLGDK